MSKDIEECLQRLTSTITTIMTLYQDIQEDRKKEVDKLSRKINGLEHYVSRIDMRVTELERGKY